jgi:dTDP-4-dehydrorhamnose reductase
MRVLILGAAGMLGHKLWQSFRDRFETWATVRSGYQEYERFDLFDSQRLVPGVDVSDFDRIVRAFVSVRPDVVINGIGVVKQAPEANDPLVCLAVNSLFPHRLANLCQSAGVRLIHVSTDCVFSGNGGSYREVDVADAQDLYGRTKFLGEVNGRGILTLRTSIIGRELRSSKGLVEWFLAHRGGKVRGFTHAIYSGFTTQALARIIADVIEQHPSLSGLYHVSSEALSKHELLCLLRDAFEMEIEIEPWPDVRIDRSLDSTRFRAATHFVPDSWPEMIARMAQDDTPYEQWRNAHHGC